MKLQINGHLVEVPSSETLVSVLAENGYDVERTGIAVAVNDAVVPRRTWADRCVEDGDRIEVIEAVQGG